MANEVHKAGAQATPSPGGEQQKPDKQNSASSELSDLTSEGNGSSLSHPTASEDADQAFDSMDEEESGTGSSDESEDNDDTPKRPEKASSREDRLKFRDLLNKKLEDMFSMYRTLQKPTKADRFNSQSQNGADPLWTYSLDQVGRDPRLSSLLHYRLSRRICPSSHK